MTVMTARQSSVITVTVMTAGQSSVITVTVMTAGQGFPTSRIGLKNGNQLCTQTLGGVPHSDESFLMKTYAIHTGHVRYVKKNQTEPR